MVIRHDTAKQFVIGQGIESRIMGHGGSIMMVENTFTKGATAPIHSHIHEQAVYIVSGTFEFTIGEEKVVVNAGDSFYVEPNVKHGCTAIVDSVVIDTFSPIREDFLKMAK